MVSFPPNPPSQEFFYLDEGSPLLTNSQQELQDTVPTLPPSEEPDDFVNIFTTSRPSINPRAIHPTPSVLVPEPQSEQAVTSGETSGHNNAVSTSALEDDSSYSERNNRKKKRSARIQNVANPVLSERKERNRLFAQQSRDRQKQLIADLQAENAVLRNEKTAVKEPDDTQKQLVTRLQEENATLKERVRALEDYQQRYNAALEPQIAKLLAENQRFYQMFATLRTLLAAIKK